MCSHVYDLVRGSTALSSCVLLEDNALTSFIVRHNYHTTPSQEVYWHAKRDLHTCMHTTYIHTHVFHRTTQLPHDSCTRGLWACQKRPTYNEQRCLSLLLRRQPNTRAHSSLLGRACPAVVLPARNDDNTVRKRARCLADDLLEDEYRSNVCCRSSIYVCGNSFMPTAVVAGTLGFVHKMCAQRFPANRMLLGAFACCVLLAQALRVEKEYVLTSAYFLTVLDHVFWSCLRVFAATDSHPNTEIQSKTRKQKLERRELTCFNMLCLPSRCIEVSKHFLTADRAVCPYRPSVLF